MLVLFVLVYSARLQTWALTRARPLGHAMPQPQLCVLVLTTFVLSVAMCSGGVPPNLTLHYPLRRLILYELPFVCKAE